MNRDEILTKSRAENVMEDERGRLTKLESARFSHCACVKTGRCPSCDAPNRICNVTTILHKKPMRSDYHVILIGESLGS